MLNKKGLTIGELLMVLILIGIGGFLFYKFHYVKLIQEVERTRQEIARLQTQQEVKSEKSQSVKRPQLSLVEREKIKRLFGEAKKCFLNLKFEDSIKTLKYIVDKYPQGEHIANVKKTAEKAEALSQLYKMLPEIRKDSAEKQIEVYEVTLQNGHKVIGRPIDETNGQIKLRIRGGEITLNRNRIKSIKKDMVTFTSIYSLKELYEKKRKDIEGNDVRGHYSLALLCFKKGLLPQAKDEFEQVKKMDFDFYCSKKEISALLLYKEGLNENNKGNRKGANKYFESILKNYPNTKMAVYANIMISEKSELFKKTEGTRKICHLCHGSGYCQACNGTGRMPCPTCRGTGYKLDKNRNIITKKIYQSKCTACNGTGYMKTTTVHTTRKPLKGQEREEEDYYNSRKRAGFMNIKRNAPYAMGQDI